MYRPSQTPRPTVSSDRTVFTQAVSGWRWTLDPTSPAAHTAETLVSDGSVAASLRSTELVKKLQE